MNRVPALSRSIALIFMTLIAGVACGGAGDSTDGRAVRVECDVQRAACEARLGDRGVTLDITPRPVATMRDLTFTLSLTGEPPAETPHIDLNMVAMDMGPNRVELTRDDTGVYTGAGVIVRCPSGKRTWMAAVTVPGAGTVEFVFDVVH
jgi:hypothetical protein